MTTWPLPQPMARAIELARLAEADGEVPIGAVVMKGGTAIGEAYNRPRALHDPTAHAEILAIRAAAAALGSERLEGCELWVTLEPCAMCAGALVLARVPRVVYGAVDPKAGAAGSVLNVLAEPKLNHRPQAAGGLLAEESALLLREFFASRR